MADNLTTVATFTTPLEAAMARNAIEAAGIRAFVADDQSIGWLWHLGTALHGIKVMVAEADAPRATEILEGFERPPDDDEPPPWTCPKCTAEVDGRAEVCWACGTTPEGVEDPEFLDADRAVAKAAGAEEAKGPPGPWTTVLVAFCVPVAILNVFCAMATPSTGWEVLAFFVCESMVVVFLFQRWYYPPAGPKPLPEPVPAELQVEEIPAPTARQLEAYALRAFLAAVLGMAFCPPLLSIYSFWLIGRYDLHRTTTEEWRPLVYLAIAINAIVCLIVLWIFLLMGGIRLK